MYPDDLQIKLPLVQSYSPNIPIRGAQIKFVWIDRVDKIEIIDVLEMHPNSNFSFEYVDQ